MNSPEEENPPEKAPEEKICEAMELKDIVYARQLAQEFPPKDISNRSVSRAEPEHYWGLSVARACARFGLPIGFGELKEESKPGDLAIYGNKETINYWLYIAGFEHRGQARSGAAKSESRSGVFTMLVCPSDKQLFEHLYSIRTNQPLHEVIQKDPMYEVRKSQPLTDYEKVDHEGVERLYDEDPEHCIRLYLTRQLPRLKHLRRTIEFTQRFISLETENNETNDEEHESLIAFNKARLEYWQTQYDFTTGLLKEGFEPYSLEDIEPFVESYTLALLATHPELSPQQLGVEIPDVQANIKKMAADLERQGKWKGQSDNAENN